GPVELDFGGIGKGYALDACAEILRSEQFDLRNWLLDAGSSTQVISGGPWSLGIGGRWKARTRLATVLRLSDGALSGSGFEVRGEHIQDVRRGGAAVRWAQSWSRAQTGAVADALSTAALALDARELAAACRELSAEILVARAQKPMFDRLRDPLKWFGRFP
ncbi:MAG: FAD:protein FMN transferase, partial [Kiritimatiellia bacterium]